MTTIIPFELKYIPVKKLAIINFEKHPDKIYRGFEIQYLDGEGYGQGHRILAYRTDGYVDVYDDTSLNEIKDEKFSVAGKGLCEHIRTNIHNIVFLKENRNAKISFEFYDKYERKVHVYIEEQSNRNSRGIDLLAPVGESSSNPDYFPVFFLYDFDFIRKAGTIAKVTIDNEEIKLDNFPFPMPKDGQLRYYSRLSFDCTIVEFAKSNDKVIRKTDLDNGYTILKQNGFEIRFDVVEITSISLANEKFGLTIGFLPSFPDLLNFSEGNTRSGKITIRDYARMGTLAGNYSVNRIDDIVYINIDLSDGWIPSSGSFLTKVLFGRKSVFRNWPKTYLYTQTIDIKTFESKSKWEKINI